MKHRQTYEASTLPSGSFKVNSFEVIENGQTEYLTLFTSADLEELNTDLRIRIKILI